jgi:fucose permease
MPQASVNQVGHHFGVTNSELGGVFRIFMIGFLIAAVGGGRLSDKYGKMPMMVVGCALMAAGMLAYSQAGSFGFLNLAAFIAGLGGGLAEVVSTALISDIYHGSIRTMMMNWTQVFFSAGAVVMPLAFARLLSSGLSWRGGYLVAAGISAFCVLAVLYASKSVGKSVVHVHMHEDSHRWREIIRNMLVLRLSASLLLYVGAEIGLASWVAAYLQNDLKSSAPMAASAVAVFWVGIGFGRMVGAALSKRLSDNTMIRWGFGLGAIFEATVLLMHAPWLALAATFMAGFCLGPTWPTIISRAGGAFPKNSGAVIGIVAAFGCAGAAIVPPLVGRVSDATGLRAALWICVASLVMGLMIMNIPSRKRGLASEA